MRNWTHGSAGWLWVDAQQFGNGMGGRTAVRPYYLLITIHERYELYNWI